jgi:phosphoribosylformylglycinamidine synthase
MKAIVHVSLKPSVLDVQGKAVGNALKSLGHETVQDVRQGKYFTFDLGPIDRAAAEREVDEMCRRLLANTVIEDYRFELIDPKGAAR